MTGRPGDGLQQPSDHQQSPTVDSIRLEIPDLDFRDTVHLIMFTETMLSMCLYEKETYNRVCVPCKVFFNFFFFNIV